MIEISDLPALNATLNGISAIFLTAGYVAIRSGHHCAEPLHRRLGADASSRASLALYNDDSDVDALIQALARVREILR